MTDVSARRLASPLLRHTLIRRRSSVPIYDTRGTGAAVVSIRYSWPVPKSTIALTYDEALYIADLLAVAADAASNEQDMPDTFPAEARLAINLILSRTDD